jgi:hypothetical protein
MNELCTAWVDESMNELLNKWMNEWMNEWITFKNHHLQLYSLNPFPQVRIFWYQIVPFG